MYADDFPKSQRLAILSEQQGHRCCYCGAPFREAIPPDIRRYRDPRPSIEHVIPLSLGGGKTWDNEVAACRGCNSARGSRDAYDFHRIASIGDYTALCYAIRGRIPVVPAPRKAKQRSTKAQRKEERRLSNEHLRLVATRGTAWPAAIGELLNTEERQRYFEMVYGVWQKPAPAAPKMKVFPSAARDDRFVTVAGIKALRWNVRSI